MASEEVEMLICGWLAHPEFMQCVVALGMCGELVVDVSGGLKGLVPHEVWQMAVSEKRLDHGNDCEIEAFGDAVELRGVHCDGVVYNATLEQLMKSG